VPKEVKRVLFLVFIMAEGKIIKGHLSIFSACLIWGLMSPIGKDAMNNGIAGIDMVAFRVVGAAVLFWFASLFVTGHKAASQGKESGRTKVPPRDLCMLALAALLGLVCNQCCFTIGLSITSPINASIITTILPIITMVLAAIFLKEPVTGKKIIGVVCGAAGALILILASARATGSKSGKLLGDILCLISQISFACYLTIFKRLIQKYDIITFEKWMFLFGSLMIIPLSLNHLLALQWGAVSAKTWGETAFVVVGATFFAYILMITGQKVLRPTIVSMYNYVQPIVACVVSVIAGLAVFGWLQGAAILLVFAGVFLVTVSKGTAV
jgi:drug/metabolite transporter (DMT)-like permease